MRVQGPGRLWGNLEIGRVHVIPDAYEDSKFTYQEEIALIRALLVHDHNSFVTDTFRAAEIRPSPTTTVLDIDYLQSGNSQTVYEITVDDRSSFVLKFDRDEQLPFVPAPLTYLFDFPSVTEAEISILHFMKQALPNSVARILATLAMDTTDGHHLAMYTQEKLPEPFQEINPYWNEELNQWVFRFNTYDIENFLTSPGETSAIVTHVIRQSVSAFLQSLSWGTYLFPFPSLGAGDILYWQKGPGSISDKLHWVGCCNAYKEDTLQPRPELPFLVAKEISDIAGSSWKGRKKNFALHLNYEEAFVRGIEQGFQDAGLAVNGVRLKELFSPLE